MATNIGRGRIVPVYLEDEMRHSYLDYSMSVIVNRALPDVRDGLKPVQRRILVAMNELGLAHDKAFRKSAKITGDVTGNYHPHGTSAVYETMVRLVQDFSLRYPLLDGQGNFGSVDGDAPAAERYTEARLTRVGEELLRDLEKNTVDFRPNYDETRQEPVVLPGIFPNLLTNGASGIAVGMATNIPPHNFGEIATAIVRIIEDPALSETDLFRIVKGPDFPTAGIIFGREGIRQAYRTGRGLITVRARAAIETLQNGKENIIVSEIPYQVNKANLLEKIADLVKSGSITGISDIRDESDREGMRVVIELKRDAQARVVMNQLFKHTQMQTTFGANLLALTKNQPRTFTLRGLIDAYIEHRREVVVRRTKFELEEAEKRAHILEGLKICLDHIDEIVQLIKKSPDPAAAKAGLIETFKLSEIQAQAILDMRLQRLTSLERKKIEDEYLELIKLIEKLKGILASERVVLAIIKEEVEALREKYGDERRTEIVSGEAEDFEIEDLIAEEDMVITISHAGYIKRLPVSSYHSQRRGGKGVVGATAREEDFIERLFIASTHSYLLFFTDHGKVHWLKVHEIPQAGRAAKGKAIVNMLEIDKGERITAFVPVKEFSEDQFLVMATKDGVIKKTILSAFKNPKRAGIRAVELAEGDLLVDTDITDGGHDIILTTRRGQAIRFAESKVRPMGRSAAGVRGVSLEEKDDGVVSMVIVKREATLLTVTEHGYGKRSAVSDYRLTNRGGKGIITIRCTERNGCVVAAREVVDGEELMFITSKGQIIRVAAQGISVIGRNTQGVRLMNLEAGDRIADVARVVSAAEEETA
jgi:DNA gyrase subunit A